MTATTLAKAKKAKTDKKMPTDKALTKGMQARERIISVAENLSSRSNRGADTHRCVHCCGREDAALLNVLSFRLERGVDLGGVERRDPNCSIA